MDLLEFVLIGHLFLRAFFVSGLDACLGWGLLCSVVFIQRELTEFRRGNLTT